MTFAASIRSEILKTKRTAALYLTVLAAIVIPFILFMDEVTPADGNAAPKIVNWAEYISNGHTAMNFVFLEMFIILASTMLLQTEFKNNAWKQVLASPQKFSTIYFSKFVVLQILTIAMLVIFNLLMAAFAIILDLMKDGETFSAFLQQWPDMIALSTRSYVASVGMSACCYWIALKWKNFVAPIGIGFVLYMLGPTLLFEFAQGIAIKYVFALPMVLIVDRFKDNTLMFQGLSLGYAAVFLIAGYLDLLLRQVSWKSLIPWDALGNPLSILQMRKNILLISWRSLSKDKYYTLINISGLTIGLVSSLFLLMYILDELSYDRYHKNADNIYRVIIDIKESDNSFTWSSTPVLLADELIDQKKGVKNAVRFFSSPRSIYGIDDKQFYEDSFHLVDSSVFDMFNWKFMAGDPATALEEPFSIVLTEKTARRYFAEPLSAVGQHLYNQEKETFVVTAVIADVPLNSHFRFDGLISLSTRWTSGGKTWGKLGAVTYVELEDDIDVDDIQIVLDSVVSQKIDPVFEERGITTKLSMQPITSIHLHSKIEDEAEAGGDISYIYVFGAVAVLILIIACINYMNLTTARSMGRVKEVGIRKVVGSLRHQLIAQFMLESILLSFIAFGISLVVIYLLLPGFNFLSNKSIEFDAIMNVPVMLACVVITFLVGVISGSYPALYLSGFNPAEVLKGTLTTRPSSSLRKTLVAVQFTISVFMIIATLIVFNQMEFMRTKDLGFNKEHVVKIPLSGSEQRKNFPGLLQQLKQLPEVSSVGMTSSVPGEGIGKMLLKVEDDEGMFTDRGVDLFFADYNYIPTMDMTIVQGRNFSENIPSDTLYAILVNESMVKRMGWTDPIGKRFRPANKSKDGKQIEKRVVGVVKDYNQSSLYDAIEPMMIILSDERNDNILVRITPGDINRSVEAISQAWAKVFSDDPFEFKFLDQDFDSQYQNDQKRSWIFTTFAGLTMLIACLGLLGLAAFTTESRTKEIGLRKIAGASIWTLMVLIVKDFLRLISVAIMIAVPLTWYLTNEWLEHFAYRIDLISEWPTFLIAGAGAITLTLITTGYHVLKAASADPVKALRS